MGKLIIVILFLVGAMAFFYKAYKAITTGYAREGNRRISLRESEEFSRYDHPFKFWTYIVMQVLGGILITVLAIWLLLWAP